MRRCGHFIFSLNILTFSKLMCCSIYGIKWGPQQALGPKPTNNYNKSSPLVCSVLFLESSRIILDSIRQLFFQRPAHHEESDWDWYEGMIFPFSLCHEPSADFHVFLQIPASFCRWHAFSPYRKPCCTNGHASCIVCRAFHLFHPWDTFSPISLSPGPRCMSAPLSVRSWIPTV